MTTQPDPSDYLADTGASTLDIAEGIENVDRIDAWIDAALAEAARCALAVNAGDWPTVEHHSSHISELCHQLGITDPTADVLIQRLLAVAVQFDAARRAAEGRPVL